MDTIKHGQLWLRELTRRKAYCVCNWYPCRCLYPPKDLPPEVSVREVGYCCADDPCSCGHPEIRRRGDPAGRSA